MSDLLSWEAPASTTFAAGSLSNIITAIDTLITADPNWRVNATDTEWIEIAPVAGPYINDRYVIRSGQVTVAGAMIRGSSPAATALLCAGSPGRGGSGPTWPSGATGEPYSGGQWTKFVECGDTTFGITALSIISSRDGLLLAFSEPGTGDTHTAILGRLLAKSDGSDGMIVSGSGAVSTGVNLDAHAQGTSIQNGDFFVGITAAINSTYPHRIAHATDIASGVDLRRINGLVTANGGAGPNDFAAIPIVLSYDSTKYYAGNVRQIKMAAKLLAGTGTVLSDGFAVARYCGANTLVNENALLFTQVL